MGKKIDLFVLIVFALIILVIALDDFIHARIGMGDIGHLQDLGVIEGSAKHYHHVKSVCSMFDRVWDGGGAVYFESPKYPQIAQKYLLRTHANTYPCQMPGYDGIPKSMQPVQQDLNIGVPDQTAISADRDSGFHPFR
ncbi:MAG: hypothetical protein K2X93_19815 [Candidatus Obscuribacterales bacterium]|nr:hypothetical protein [Candidatus Obscuribacterales bacterium]